VNSTFEAWQIFSWQQILFLLPSLPLVTCRFSNSKSDSFQPLTIYSLWVDNLWEENCSWKLFLIRSFILRRMSCDYMCFVHSCLWNEDCKSFIQVKKKVIQAKRFVIIKWQWPLIWSIKTQQNNYFCLLTFFCDCTIGKIH
jgi:hypothetical protein